MKKYKLFILLSISLLTLISCKSDDPTQPKEEETYLKATINGEEYIGKIADFNTDDETYFYIESVSENGKEIVEIYCNFPPSIGSFEFSQLQNSIRFLYSDTAQDGTNPTRVYQTGVVQGNLSEGTLNISAYQTDIYNTSLKGTFSFSAPCYGGTCDENGVVATSNITNASFFVKLN